MILQINIFILAFIISYLLSDFFTKYTIDNKKVLKVGGIIIFAAVVSAMFMVVLFKKDLAITGYSLKKIIGFAVGSVIILSLGIYDDLKKIGYRGKLLWQLAAIAPLLISGYSISRLSLFTRSIEIYWSGYILLVFWVLLITNALNLIDGLDGLACGVAIIAFSVLAVVTHLSFPVIQFLSLACIGSLLAFLKYNFYPAKLYLGDNGSLLLGYALAVSSLEANVKMNTLTALALPVLILMLPIGSAVYSFFRRLGKGRNPFLADRLHLHYLLLRSGIPHHVVVLLFWLSSVVLAMLGLISYFLGRRFEFFILSLGIIAVILAYNLSIGFISRERKHN
jgi:UDP-GlcNAc:undecaprenyl-phosphate GlcNAc-1-phosphate transferase